MTLTEIIDDLKYGELSSHGIFMSGISEANKKMLVAHINNVLTDLYTRFPLLTQELTLKLQPGITEYPLKSEYALTKNPAKGYIMDSVFYPFTDDVIRIDTVNTECGTSVSMNNQSSCIGVATPSPTTLQVASPIEDMVLFVGYQAKHPVVTLTTTELLLPQQFKTALLAYVASRVYSGGTAQEHMALSATLYQKYELQCLMIRTQGVDNDINNDTNMKLSLGGWV